MANLLPVDEFISLQLSENIPVVDVRSPAEFEHAHIPGAKNIALLNNEDRVIIGTTFKSSGREAAIEKGFELAGNKFSGYITRAKEIATDKKLMIYCWRGGLRSNVMSWLFSMSGIKVYTLKHGYKNFRVWAFRQFTIEKNLIVLGGKTGCGKTEMLHELKNSGEQIIDLEAMACHKGSAFGNLGQPAQPSNEMFENLLAMEWYKTDSEKNLWIENESRSIGKNIIPTAIFEFMRKAPVAEIYLEKEIRKKRILQEYGHFSNEELQNCTIKIQKRLGGLRLKNALQHLEENNLSAWCDIMLGYYDKAYETGNETRKKESILKINLPSDDFKKNIDILKKNVTGWIKSTIV